MEDLKELKCIYDGRKSFYKKAYVKTISYEKNDGCITYYELYSYNTLVCKIVYSNGQSYYELNKYSFYSNTTIRHVKEFIKQYLIPNEVKSILNKNNYNKNIIQKYNNTYIKNIY